MHTTWKFVFHFYKRQAFIYTLFRSGIPIMVNFLFVLTSLSCFFCVSAVSPYRQTPNPFNFILGNKNLGPLSDGILGKAQAPAPGPALFEPKVPLVLAGNRTERPDVLQKFRIYQGGWDISNKHYWASVAFTGAAGFIIGLVWLVTFGTMLLVHHCSGWRISFKGKGSPLSQKIRILLLILFSCASMVGCILLSIGQLELHNKVMHTMKYVVIQSDNTAQMLRNVSDYLSIAKTVDVPQFKLPQSTMQEIDELSMRLGTGAETLTNKTSENSVKVKSIFNNVRSALIIVASVMLVLAVLGLVLSLFGCQSVIHIFIISGWLLVAVTLTLWGTFMIFNSAIQDSRLAMKEWVDNPKAETALSNILPCDDESATNTTLFESRRVVSMLINTVNAYIYTAANTNRPPSDQFYYNQTGPLIPPLCYPFDDKLQDRECSPQEVSMTNASMTNPCGFFSWVDNGNATSSVDGSSNEEKGNRPSGGEIEKLEAKLLRVKVKKQRLAAENGTMKNQLQQLLIDRDVLKERERVVSRVLYLSWMFFIFVLLGFVSKNFI